MQKYRIKIRLIPAITEQYGITINFNFFPCAFTRSGTLYGNHKLSNGIFSQQLVVQYILDSIDILAKSKIGF